MKKLGRPYADGLHHLSYGMVDLPSGRMKSREGTIVDADDLLNEVKAAAEVETLENGRIEGLSKEQLEDLFEMIGIAALKYFIMRVQPKKRMVFDPQESVSIKGDTGPFIQYSYARSRSIAKKADEKGIGGDSKGYQALHDSEKAVIRQIAKYPKVLAESANEFDPSLVCAFAIELAKSFNRMLNKVHVLRAENEDTSRFRLELCGKVAFMLKHSAGLLGIKVPEQM